MNFINGTLIEIIFVNTSLWNSVLICLLFKHFLNEFSGFIRLLNYLKKKLF